jgi:hypothetical protein
MAVAVSAGSMRPVIRCCRSGWEAPYPLLLDARRLPTCAIPARLGPQAPQDTTGHRPASRPGRASPALARQSATRTTVSR